MPYKIYADFSMSDAALERLQNGIGEHELVRPAKLAGSVLGKTEVDPAFYDCDVAFGQPDPDAISQAQKLKWIQINTSGITRYDNESFRTQMSQRSIPVCNSAHVYNEACADHVFSFMLAQSRQLPAALGFSAANGSEDWFRLRRNSKSLRGETVVIVGYGAIASRLVELLQPYEMKVLAYRRKARGDEGIPILSAEQLPSALGEADHVVNILPDSELTRNFFDAERLKACKAGSVFYNIGRGATVNQDALAQSLQSGEISSAWLDVTDPEPLPQDHPLLSLSNCYITPHIAGGFSGEELACIEHFLANLERFEREQTLADRVM